MPNIKETTFEKFSYEICWRVMIYFVAYEVTWNFNAYKGRVLDDPCWTCPGCDYLARGKNWSSLKLSHKKRCSYYITQHVNQVYHHEDSRCICCVYDGDSKINGWKVTKNLIHIFKIFKIMCFSTNF